MISSENEMIHQYFPPNSKYKIAEYRVSGGGAAGYSYNALFLLKREEYLPAKNIKHISGFNIIKETINEFPMIANFSITNKISIIFQSEKLVQIFSLCTDSEYLNLKETKLYDFTFESKCIKE